jgi:hypothetical protein
MSRRITALGVSLVCAAALAAGTAGVFAATVRPAVPRIVAYGTLTSLNGNAATLTTPGNAVLNVALDPHAVFVARSEGAATGGLHVGEQVAVRGRSVNGDITATSIAFNTSSFSIGAMTIAGTVGSITPNAITVSRHDGQTSTVTLATDTKYFVNGKRVASEPAIVVGEKLSLVAKRMTDGSFVAATVHLHAA